MFKVVMFFVWLAIAVLFCGIALLTDRWTTLIVAVPICLLAFVTYFEGDV